MWTNTLNQFYFDQHAKDVYLIQIIKISTDAIIGD